MTNTLFKGSMLALLLMIFGMVIIGGLTRLTGSGLSIVEWKPITGILPPLSLEGWLHEFGKYQQSPEFQKINAHMTLPAFQSIFWLEYIHRLVGRLLGLILFIPTFLMIFKKYRRDLWPYLALLWILGAAQGLMGWVMVKSGLVHDPHVSPYRLAAHLLLGFAIFGIALWMTFSLYHDHFYLERKGYSQKALKALKRFSLFALLLVVSTAFWGALVAGLKAGLLYNTFPLMGGSLIPHEFLTSPSLWQDLFENPVSVQFLHRVAALTTTLFCGWLWWYQRTLFISRNLSRAFTGMALAALIQASLGIATLLFEVPLSFAILHQGFAFILFGNIIFVVFVCTR